MPVDRLAAIQKEASELYGILYNDPRIPRPELRIYGGGDFASSQAEVHIGGTKIEARGGYDYRIHNTRHSTIEVSGLLAAKKVVESMLDLAKKYGNQPDITIL